jgi:2'-5' RNA ligase
MTTDRARGDAYRQVWQAFRALPATADGRHDTDDWRSRAGPFALALIRVPASALQPALDRLRGAIAGFPFVRVHPDGFHHVTLQELGFLVDRPGRPDEIGSGRLEEFAEAAAAVVAERPPFALRFGGANSFQDAAFLEVHDDGALTPLHARLLELAAIPRAPRFAYLPHLTVAHYAAAAPGHDIEAALSRWRTTPFGSLEVSAVEIALLRNDEPYPPLEPWAVLPLGG